MGNLYDLGEFRNFSLRDYLTPVYAALKTNVQIEKDKKRDFVLSLYPLFFKRMRRYRDVTLKQIAERGIISEVDVSLFEDGKGTIKIDFETIYADVCNGHYECSYFAQQIYEFHNPPDVKFLKETYASVLKRTGILICDMRWVTNKDFHIYEFKKPTIFGPSI